MQSERSPLLQSDIDDIHSAPPPPYSELHNDLAALGDPDAPGGSKQSSIKCEVCSYSIALKQKKNKKIITCPRCQESTALGPPDKGKRYFRCPECNCLMVMRIGVARSICPRENCKTTIDVKTGKPIRNSRPSTSNDTFNDIQQNPQYRIVCGHCHGTFVQDTSPTNNRIRCPLCRKQSHIGESAARRTGTMYIGAGLACVVACLGLMATTMGLRHNSGYWYIYMILMVLAVILILRGLICLCMKHSVLELTQTIA